MIATIRKAGYDVALTADQATGAGQAAEDVEQQAREAEIQSRRRRVIVGLIFTIPAFALSMSRDFGLLDAVLGTGAMTMAHASPLNAVVNWILFALALPVQLYVGYPYYVGGAKSLRNGSANMDVLVALGSSVAFAYSCLVMLGPGQRPCVFRDLRADPDPDQRWASTWRPKPKAAPARPSRA